MFIESWWVCPVYSLHQSADINYSELFSAWPGTTAPSVQFSIASSSSKLRINLMRLQLTIMLSFPQFICIRDTSPLSRRHIPIIHCTMKPFWDICKGFVAFLSAFQNSRLVRTVEVLVVCVTGELGKEWNIEGALHPLPALLPWWMRRNFLCRLLLLILWSWDRHPMLRSHHLTPQSGVALNDVVTSQQCWFGKIACYLIGSDRTVKMCLPA